MFEKGQSVRVVKTDKLPGNTIAPPLQQGEIKEIISVCTDSKGHQHIDVGIPSKYNFIRSFETKEELPQGDKIHWCHPSRFELI